MAILFRFLGAAAGVSARLSRVRGNGIPLNVLILIALGVTLVIGGDMQLRDASQYGRPPTPVAVGDVVGQRGLVNRYVTVTGPLYPGEAIVYGSQTRALHDEKVFVPMADPRTKRALLVENPAHGGGGLTARAVASEVKVTGMLRGLRGDLRSSLRQRGDQLGPLTVETDYQLDAGATPANPSWFGFILLVAGLPFALLLTSLLLRHVVFLPMPDAGANTGVMPPSPESDDLRLTGQLRFGPKVARRFLNVPAVLGTVPETGECAFVSNIDASEKIYGTTTRNLAGLWSLVIRSGSLPDGGEPGLLFAGPRPRPALRLRFTDGATGKPATAILSFASEAARDAMRDRLAHGLWRPAAAARPAPETAAPPPGAAAEAVGFHLPDAAAAAAPLVAYRPSGRCSPGGAVVMLACAIAGAAAVGGLYFLLTQFIDIPILMPVVGGLAVGGMTVLAVRAGRCRSAGLALIAGALAGLLMYGTRLTLDSQQLRPQIVSAISRSLAEGRGISLPAARARVERALTPWKTLRLFLLVQAHVGVGIGDADAKSVTRVSREEGSEVLRSGSHFTIQGPYYWLMLAVEAGLVALVAGVMGAAGAAAPFCDSCCRWYRSRRLLRADPTQAQNLAAAAQGREWARLIRTPPGGTDQNYSEVVLARCPKCAAATLAVKIAPATRKANLHVHIEPAVADYLQANAPPGVKPGGSQRAGA